ncbi:MAG: M23 family metallopeptidase [Myxococcota bacterium]
MSKRYGLSVAEIAEVNGLAEADVLRAGQRLFLPAVSVSSSSSSEPDTQVSSVETAGSSSLTWPLEQGVLLREFTPQGTLPYEGLLLAAPRDTPVHAAAAGLVVYVGEEEGFGRMVVLSHPEDMVTVYAHLERVQVREGQRVQQRQRIAYVGETGEAESPQLHFEVRSGRSPVDPLLHLPPP